jgi:hypothetical protein
MKTRSGLSISKMQTFLKKNSKNMQIFNPVFTPYEALELGIFDGKYYLDTNPDFKHKPIIQQKNIFCDNASQSLDIWKQKGWITPEDPMGWFQWYTRWYHGRRIEKLDNHQIKRWRSFVARHGALVKKYGNGDLKKRAKTRQALLHWCGDPIPDIQVENKFDFLLENGLTSVQE